MALGNVAPPMAEQDQARPARPGMLRALGQLKLRDMTPSSLRATGARLEQVRFEASKTDDTPEGVPTMDRHAKAAYQMAQDLAARPGSDDEAAAAELRRAARKHPDALRVAEINSRAGGRFRDFEVEGRTQRLLEAAASGRPVRPVTDPERRRIDTIARFSALPADEQWQRLRHAVPELSALWADAEGGRFARPPIHQDMAPEEQRQAWQETRRRFEDLRSSVGRLVGPAAHPDDPLAGSRYVENFVMANLPSGPPPPPAPDGGAGAGAG